MDEKHDDNEKCDIQNKELQESNVVPFAGTPESDMKARAKHLERLARKLEAQREVLNRAAEFEFRRNAPLDSPKVREELERFNELASQYSDEIRQGQTEGAEQSKDGDDPQSE